MATVSLELAGAGGTANAAVKRMVQRTSDRRKDDLIDKKVVSDIRRIRPEAQDDETKSALLGRHRQSTALNIQTVRHHGISDLQNILRRDF
jgi:hypothetical protein